MPTLAELRQRYTAKSAGTSSLFEDRDAEALIFDGRHQWTPKQFVESKYRRALTEMEQRAAEAPPAFPSR
jgi:hypothetical protein